MIDDQIGEALRGIDTTPRGGFVEQLEERLMASEQPPLVVPSRQRRGARRVVATTVVIGMSIALVALVVVLRRPTPPSGPVAPRAVGADVAWVDRRGLVVHAAGATRDVVVARGSVLAPRWSPSGRWLAYHDAHDVYAVSRDGRTRRVVGPFQLDVYPWSRSRDLLAVLNGHNITVWNFTRDPVANAVGPGPDVPVAEWSATSLAWSRSGSTLFVSMLGRVHAGPGQPFASLWRIPLTCRADGICLGDAQKLRYRPGQDDYPLLLAGTAFNDADVLFWRDYIGSGSVLLDGVPLDAIPSAGGTPRQLAPNVLLRANWVRESPDGTRLLVVAGIGRMVTDSRVLTICGTTMACQPLAPGPDVQTLDPAWSPDGRSVAFVREEHGSATPRVVNGNIDWRPKYQTRRLWIAAADGTQQREITTAGGGVALPAFSPDGHSITFVRDERLWLLDLRTNRLRPLTPSLRLSTAPCSFDDCLPDEAVYETQATWLDHVAIHWSSQ